MTINFDELLLQYLADYRLQTATVNVKEALGRLAGKIKVCKNNVLELLEDFLVVQKRKVSHLAALPYISKASIPELWARLTIIRKLISRTPSENLNAELAAIIGEIYKRLNSVEKIVQKLISSLRFTLKKLTYCFDLRLILRTKIVDRFKYLNDFSGSEEADVITRINAVYSINFNSIYHDKSKSRSYRSFGHSYC